jgi:sulfatase maturation enzyme AslB (radical SAM superfamily)
MSDPNSNLKKFDHPTITATGEERASVIYGGTQTLWFNTGTLCNIECVNCYIESSPTNERLVYLTLTDILPYLDELEAAGETGIEIGFTGGEPFMAPECLDMVRAALARGHRVLILTNAMQPMMRPRIKAGLMELLEEYGPTLTLRVSLDHYTQTFHDEERGAGAFELTLRGLRWLAENGFSITLAGRSLWEESDVQARAGFGDLIKQLGLPVDPLDPTQLVIFPEMKANDDPPEITTACWGILGKDPAELMCASQRMVVKRKGQESPAVVACTLLPYLSDFELGSTLSDSRKDVALNHPFCASFCVLGGGSCSA